jgi:serine/threonine-protein kinase RsbW
MNDAATPSPAGLTGQGRPGHWFEIARPRDVIRQANWLADVAGVRPEEDGVEISMVLYLPRDAASVPVTRQVLDGCLETLGVTPDTRADIALALSEACANVIQHAGPGDEYEVQASARNGHCAIEVVNTGSRAGKPAPDGSGTGAGEDDAIALSGDPVPATAEHGRGLKIINAVVDNLQLTGSKSEGTIVHFEKTLRWLPGAAGQHLLNAGVYRPTEN